MLVWIDVETTGIDERTGSLLEVALVLTGDDLEEKASTRVVIDPPRGDWSGQMSELVREMHTKNGLIEEVKASNLTLREAVTHFLDWGGIYVCNDIPLAGCNVSFDRRWIRHHMPEVEKLFHYRSVDVSSITELAKRWAPTIYEGRPRSTDGHRALSDALGAINLLRYYRRTGFVGGVSG